MPSYLISGWRTLFLADASYDRLAKLRYGLRICLAILANGVDRGAARKIRGFFPIRCAQGQNDNPYLVYINSENALKFKTLKFCILQRLTLRIYRVRA